jgi:hypothetical protein
LNKDDDFSIIYFFVRSPLFIIFNLLSYKKEQPVSFITYNH